MQRDHPFRRGLGLSIPALVVSLLVVKIALPAETEPKRFAPSWIDLNLSGQEIQSVRKLASKIAERPASPEDAPEAFREAIRKLSIREAAGLGTILMDQYGINPKPWLALPSAREQEARNNLKNLLGTFDSLPDIPRLRRPYAAPSGCRSDAAKPCSRK